MDTQAQHLIADLVLKKSIEEKDIVNIKNIIEKNFNIVNKIEHKFSPHGETIVFILSESHFSIHTYPEHNYLSFDIYVCDPDKNLELVLVQIKNSLEIKSIDYKIFERGKVALEEKTFYLRFLYFLTIIVAMGSILYELLLAQTLSTIMGNTALRYNVTIGIYIASMGFGALLYKKIIKSNDLVSKFIKVELLLTIIGGLAPILVLAFDNLLNNIASNFQLSYYSQAIQLPSFFFNHFLIVAVGFISGLELPLLIDIGKKLYPSKTNQVLAFDYLGTLIGAILFPIALLPSFNLFLIGFIVSFLNVIVTVLTQLVLPDTNRRWIYFSLLIMFIWIYLISKNEMIKEILINNLYFNGKFK